ncbi:30S ribosomal protein S9 [Alphaproteobacteria bacterium]|jgi:small subunit ribosomal protein S9|nr:30S ribosomal protein S9 [Alphaproteobacteria bacterium]MDB2635953.1 30S ribosomal protein S9 [Alphaproteobacteria bacterium]MDC0594781.1 30S ribosomal protein S9 [Alphaproteobacteria bacterium]|tara:strand:- start:731 stop:1129 length:399 start_codon:yes stop_codon:yes gene_type:complete
MKLMSDQVYSTGRRKESIAKVWLSSGSGNIIINKKKIEDYFPDKALRMIINQPLEVSKKTDSVDLKITVLGGGLSGQAGAIKHGLSRALTLIDPNTKDTLKKNGFLTRDSRTVERKKYGRAKARRSFQFSKR